MSQMGEPNQIIQGANDDGTPTGEVFPKELGHTGAGKHHLAISIILVNPQDQILLQQRKHLVFDDIWDVTLSSHQLHREDGSNETDEEAAMRALKREYGITEVKNLKNWGGVNYFAQYGGFCENEHDIFLTADYDGNLNLNPEVGYGYEWLDRREFLEDIEANPQSYAPWVVKGTQLLKEKGFFN
jgi:isopentenyldiphosphate isomerase